MMLTQKWREALAIYRRRDIILVGFLGFSSGLPLLLTLSVMSYWLASLGIGKSAIGLFALVGVPYNLKFLWAPLIDKLPIPYVSERFGQRRAWAWLSQAALALAIVALGFSDPSTNIYVCAILALCVAFFSATQDVVLDALRIELLSTREQGGGAASFIGGYRLAMLAVGGGALVLSDYIVWPLVFCLLAMGLLVGALAVAYAREPTPPKASSPDKAQQNPPQKFRSFLQDAVIAPFQHFFTHRHAWIILLFVVLYKYGDAFGGVMANPFYLDLGFSGSEIGVITKIWGLGATLLGVFGGGVLVARYGIMPALLIGGILQATTNIFFIALATIGDSILLLTVAIAGDNFTGGIGTAALVAYLSHLCNVRHTATQYALLSSLAAVGRTFLSSGAGFAADAVGWVSFFGLTMLLAVPALWLCWFLYRSQPLSPPPSPL